MLTLDLKRQYNGSSFFYYPCFKIIEAVSAAQRPLSPLDLSEILDIPKPTMHRLIQQLQEEGFVRVDINGTIVPASRTRTYGDSSGKASKWRFSGLRFCKDWWIKSVKPVAWRYPITSTWYIPTAYLVLLPYKCICPLIRKHPFGVRRLVKSSLSTLTKDDGVTLLKIYR